MWKEVNSHLMMGRPRDVMGEEEPGRQFDRGLAEDVVVGDGVAIEVLREKIDDFAKDTKEIKAEVVWVRKIYRLTLALVVLTLIMVLLTLLLVIGQFYPS